MDGRSMNERPLARRVPTPRVGRSARRVPAPRVGRIALLLSGLLALACGGPPAVEHRAAPGALGPYSGSVTAGGLVFASGKIGERGGSFAHEAETALQAVADELARAGCGLDDLVSVTVYLTDMDLYDAFNEVYAATLPSPWPARVCVAVAALPGGARVEVAGVAARR